MIDVIVRISWCSIPATTTKRERKRESDLPSSDVSEFVENLFYGITVDDYILEKKKTHTHNTLTLQGHTFCVFVMTTVGARRTRKYKNQ